MNIIQSEIYVNFMKSSFFKYKVAVWMETCRKGKFNSYIWIPEKRFQQLCHFLSGLMPHGSACVDLWSDVSWAVYVISIVHILADITECVKAGQFDFLVVTATSKSQGKIRKDAFEMWCYEKPGERKWFCYMKFKTTKGIQRVAFQLEFKRNIPLNIFIFIKKNKHKHTSRFWPFSRFVETIYAKL